MVAPARTRRAALRVFDNHLQPQLTQPVNEHGHAYVHTPIAWHLDTHAQPGTELPLPRLPFEMRILLEGCGTCPKCLRTLTCEMDYDI